MRKTFEWKKTVWNAIPNHDGYYASEDGQLLSMKKQEPFILTPMASKDGHLYVYMYDEGESKKVWVHRAVLSAFCGKEEKDLICRHLDDDPSNNHINNLVWGTRQQNADDRKKNKGYPKGEKSSSAKLDHVRVMEIRNRYAEGESSADLSIEYGISKNSVLKVVRGDSWAHLPTVPVRVKHSSRRKTPLSEEHIRKFVNGGRKYAGARKVPRKMVMCACGCGSLIETPDRKGRSRKFLKGHNTRGMHWEWKKNGKINKDTVV